MISKNGSILYHSDCMEILNHVEDESIDCIITDPPYFIGYDDWDTKWDIASVSSQWHRILKPNGSVFCFCGWSGVCEVIGAFNKSFKLNDWIIYDRIKGRGAKRRMVSTREDLLWYVKSDSWTFNKDFAYSTIKKKTKGMGSKNGHDCRALSNVWTDISPIVPWSKERYNHPTQKPLAISKRIVEVFTNEGDVVMDCYMGGGSILKSAIDLNRKVIGIEKNEKYFEIAKNLIFDKNF